MIHLIYTLVPSISTKRTTTSRLKTVENKKKATTYGVGNPSPVLEQAQQLWLD